MTRRPEERPATTTLRPEQLKAREYFEQKGSRLPVTQIRERVAASFVAIEEALAAVGEADARRRPAPGEWSVHEVVDHLVVTHRPTIGELHDLLAGQSPAGPPIPAGLQSADPMARRWPDLLVELHALHAEANALLAGATDAIPMTARAPIVMVVNVTEAGGGVRPLHWIEPLDWKAYAAVGFRLHVLDHLSQVKKTVAALRATA